MKLTVLGKYGPYPAANGGTGSYLVRSGETAVALDFGSAALGRLQRYIGLEQLDAIVLSHLHLDHIGDLLPLSYALKDRKLNLYLPLTDGAQYDLISSFECFNLIPVFHRRELRVKDFSLEFFQMTHPVESYAVKVSDGASALFYSGDTSFNDKLIGYAAGAKLLLLDCCQPSSAKNVPHMTLAEGAFVGRSAGAKVLATHVSPEAPPYAEAKTLGIEIAEEMTTYSV